MAESAFTTKLAISENKLVKIYSIALVIGLLGVFLSYHTYITSSNAWIVWGNDQAWIGDSLRIFVLYCLAVLLIKTSFRAGRKRGEVKYEIRLNPANLAISGIFLLTVLILNFYYYPIYFELELLKPTGTFLEPEDRELVRQSYFQQVYKPFFTYVFYSGSLWLGIILPTFLLLLNGFIEDIRSTKQTIKEMATCNLVVSLKKKWKQKDSHDLLRQTLSDLQVLNDDCILGMRHLVQRYLPALLVVITGYIAFNILLSDAAIAPDRQFAKAQTAEARSSFGWIILIYLLIFVVFIYKFATVFNRYRLAVKDAIDGIRELVEDRSPSYEYRDIIQERTEHWDINRKNLPNFIVSTLVTTGSLSLPIMILFLGVLVGAIVQYSDELVPISIMNFINEKFTQPKL